MQYLSSAITIVALYFRILVSLYVTSLFVSIVYVLCDLADNLGHKPLLRVCSHRNLAASLSTDHFLLAFPSTFTISQFIAKAFVSCQSSATKLNSRLLKFKQGLNCHAFACVL